MRFVCGIPSSVAAFVVAATLVVPPCVAAQEQERPTTAASPFVAAFQVPIAASVLPSSAQRPAIVLPEPPAAKRPEALIPLYASLAVLQGLDVHSTRRGLSSGGREANPLMEPVVKNGAAFIAVKAATTAGMILASERLWKKNRKAAVLLTVLTNAGLAAVVAHNYHVSR